MNDVSRPAETPSLFSLPNELPHEKVRLVTDVPSGLRCIIAVHSTARGPAFGGCRMWRYTDDHAALNDVLRVSHGMSLKNALADLPFGGGKAVILLADEEFDRPALFAAFGRAVQASHGSYITATRCRLSAFDLGRRKAAIHQLIPVRPQPNRRKAT